MATDLEEAQSAALLSLMDVVQELADAVGEPDWAEVVKSTFDLHRTQLRAQRISIEPASEVSEAN